MKKIFILIAFLVLSSFIFAQEGTKTNSTAPYFQKNVRVKDTLGVGKCLILNGDTIIHIGGAGIETDPVWNSEKSLYPVFADTINKLATKTDLLNLTPIDTTSLSNRINLKRDLSNVGFDSLQVNYISPKDSSSFEIHNHSNSSLITFEDGQRHIGTINGYFGTYKGLDFNAGNYYKNGLWYRSTIYKPLCFFENLNAGTFEFWSENAGALNSPITWTYRKAYINSVGSFYGYDLHASNSIYVTDSIVNTSLTNTLAGKSDTANVALLATANTFTKANTFNDDVIIPNIASNTSATEIVVLNGTTLTKDVLVDISGTTLNRINSDTLSVNNSITFGGLTSFTGVQLLVDDGSIVLPSSMTGWGTVQIGDSQEYAKFLFKTDGTVTLLENSANVVSTDTDVKLCIFDSGTTVTIRNRLGSSLKLRYNIYYSAN